MANILIASLGESPIVVTAMIRALKEKIELDKVVVIYPNSPNIEYGVELIENHSLCKAVERYALAFRDVNTTGYCNSFLRSLYEVLENHQNDTLYLSLAGGRKSMSALMFLFAPFYKNIKGLYHILDKNEDDKAKRNFHPIEDLIELHIDENPNLDRIMNPSSDDMNLIEIPFDHFAKAEELIEILKTYNPNRLLDGVSVFLDDIELEAMNFWAAIFQKKTSTEFYEIKFSENARKQFENHKANKDIFSRYFSSSKLKHPDWANKSGKHVTFKGKDKTKFHIAKIGATAERVAWWYDEKHDDVVIAELGVEEEEHDHKYYRLGTSSVLNKDYFAKKTVQDYFPERNPPSQKAILLAAVGKSPMVVTQAYTLLQQRESVNIDKVAVVFPEKNGTIKKGIRIIKDAFRREAKKTVVMEYGAALKDVASKEDCETFLDCMIHAIDDLRKKYPDSQIRLLLSGGRKGMTALSYFAAQRSEITKVYHTLITDSDLEERIENECSIENLNRLGSAKKKAEKLFLESYSLKDFDRFEIPIVPLRF